LPSDKPGRRLEDIVENVQVIQGYVAGMELTEFGRDQKTYDAVERCLERISEAAAKLGDLAASLVPGQPWQEIKALGNRLRHEYDAIREDRLWDIVQIDLPPLCAACEEALRRLREVEGQARR
jgi:uncharacterized protein with HEPN domain